MFRLSRFSRSAIHVGTPGLIALLLLITLSTRLFADPADDWPRFLGPNRDGSAGPTPIIDQFPADGPKIAWTRKVGQGFAGPVVAGGRVILFHRIDNEEVVELMEAATGKSIWKSAYQASYRDDFGFDEGPRATPAVADGRIFTFGADGIFSAWNQANGKRLWQIDVRTQYRAGKGFFGVAGSPLVDGKKVIVNAGGKDGAGLVAFDVADGKLIWKALDDEGGYASPVAAEIGGLRCILAVTRSFFSVIEADSGKVVAQMRFRARLNASVNAASPLVADDQIFITSSYGVGAALLKLKDTKLETLWSGDESLSCHYATPVRREGLLFGFDGRQEQGCNLRCVELDTGKVRWSEPGLGAGTVTLAGDKLVILTEKGELILAPASGQAFKPTTRGNIGRGEWRAHPALAGGRLYARSGDALVCVDLGK